MRQSRRNFLKTGMTIGAGVALSNSGCSHVSQYLKNFWGPIDLTTHTVIIGAGLAGLSCAYKLKQKNLPYKIFEASHRVGGRVYTLNDFQVKGSRVELGGEFISDQHESIKVLAKNLSFSLVKSSFDKKYFIEEGAEALAVRLKDRVCSVIPDQILKLNHQLIAIKEFEKSYILTFKTDKELIKVKTNRLVLALPLVQLKNVQGLYEIATGLNKYTQYLDIQQTTKLILSFDQMLPSHNWGEFWQPSLSQEANRQLLLSQINSVDLTPDRLAQYLKQGLAPVNKALTKKAAMTSTKAKSSNLYLPKSHYLQDWSKVRYIEMSSTALNTNKKIKLQNFEIARNIYAIGEHMSPEYAGTMNGAIDSGQKLAEMLLPLTT